MDELMQRRIRALGRSQNRGTILVASTNRAFVGTVGEMVADNGFRPAYPEEREAAWLSVTRTQPCIAICDCEGPVEPIQRLILEAWARHVPVLASMPEQSIDARVLKLRRVARFALPTSREALGAMLDALLARTVGAAPGTGTYSFTRSCDGDLTSSGLHSVMSVDGGSPRR